MATGPRKGEEGEPARPRQPGVTGEREVPLPPAYEGQIGDGPIELRHTPPETPTPWQGARRAPGRRGLGPDPEIVRELPLLRVYGLAIRRFALGLGAATATFVPAFLPEGVYPDLRARAALPGVMALKGATLLALVLYVGWRLALRHGAARGSAYIFGVWAAALGFGLLVAGAHPNLGTLFFDAGALAVILLILGDGYLRRRITSHRH